MIQITRILEEARGGRPQAQRQLAAALYEELRAMARREMAGERSDHTLQPTALVHEAWLRLMPDDGAGFENRAHFFGAAATALRRVLVDHARKHGRDKRGGGQRALSLDAVDAADPIATLDDRELIELDDALTRLAEFAPLPARVVELRFFAGMPVDEVARTLKISPSSVQRAWRVARAWLRGRLAHDGN